MSASSIQLICSNALYQSTNAENNLVLSFPTTFREQTDATYLAVITIALQPNASQIFFGTWRFRRVRIAG